jgi:hypothetical protein
MVTLGRRIWLVAAALATASCGRSAQTTNPGADSAAPNAGADSAAPIGLGSQFADFCTALAAALYKPCPFPCLPADPIDKDLPIAGAYYCDALQKEVASGHLLFDPTHAAACLASFKDVSCRYGAGPDDHLSECRAALKGTIPAGQSCRWGSPVETSTSTATLHSELGITTCSEGLYCIGAPGAGKGHCPGVCSPLAKIGESCISSACVGGAACFPDGTCQPHIGLGGVCPGVAYNFCDYGLYCEFQDAGVSTCQPAHTSGPCYGNDCAPDYACAEALYMPPGQCVPVRVPLGEACSPHDWPQCGCASYCAADNSDAGTGTCKAWVEVGSPCGANERDCNGGTCSGGLNGGGTCQAWLLPGEPCGTGPGSGSCYLEDECDLTTHTCVPLCFGQ